MTLQLNALDQMKQRKDALILVENLLVQMQKIHSVLIQTNRVSCHCVKGYVCNRCGVCVLPEQCPEKCEPPVYPPFSDPNEVIVECYKNSTARVCNSCPQPSDDPREDCERNKCDCREGYLRNKCVICVPESECNSPKPCEYSNPCQKKNEVYRCVTSCGERTCRFLDEISRCRPNCTWRYDCAEGYRRDIKMCSRERWEKN